MRSDVVNKVLLEHSYVFLLMYVHGGFHTIAAKLSGCNTGSVWPAKPKIITNWSFREKQCADSSTSQISSITGDPVLICGAFQDHLLSLSPLF